MITIFLVVSIIVNAVLGYIVYNTAKKMETYESAVEQFYSALSIVLHNLRAIDEKQMFENDDEVGSVFQQIVDIVNELRPLLYGNSNDAE